MKYILSTLILIFLFSSENPAGKSNERLKTVLKKKNRISEKTIKNIKPIWEIRDMPIF